MPPRRENSPIEETRSTRTYPASIRNPESSSGFRGCRSRRSKRWTSNTPGGARGKISARVGATTIASPGSRRARNAWRRSQATRRCGASSWYGSASSEGNRWTRGPGPRAAAAKARSERNCSASFSPGTRRRILRPGERPAYDEIRTAAAAGLRPAMVTRRCPSPGTPSRAARRSRSRDAISRTELSNDVNPPIGATTRGRPSIIPSPAAPFESAPTSSARGSGAP